MQDETSQPDSDRRMARIWQPVQRPDLFAEIWQSDVASPTYEARVFLDDRHVETLTGDDYGDLWRTLRSKYLQADPQP